MGIYRKYLFPRILDWILGREEEIRDLRKELLKDLSGDVLEIGFGTGLNLPYYPPAVRRLSVVDPNPGMHRIAEKRVKAAPMPVVSHQLNGESLPFPDESFDAVVSTFTLCSISGVERALSEARRVLKPKGRFYFLEHGLSDEAKVQRWQHRLTPLQKILADGCHLDRKIDVLVEGAGLKPMNLKKFYIECLPKVVGFAYLGTAERGEVGPSMRPSGQSPLSADNRLTAWRSFCDSEPVCGSG
jgi:SAM-dependent methyltransferase